MYNPLLVFKGSADMTAEQMAAALNDYIGFPTFAADEVKPMKENGWLEWDDGKWTLWGDNLC